MKAEEKDPLYEEAKQVVIQMKYASASLFQRRLRLGYARANRLLDQLTANNIISDFEGKTERRVLIESTPSQPEGETERSKEVSLTHIKDFCLKWINDNDMVGINSMDWSTVWEILYQFSKQQPPIKENPTVQQVGDDIILSENDINNAQYQNFGELKDCPLCGKKPLSYGKLNQQTGNTVYHLQCSDTLDCSCNVFYCSKSSDDARQKAIELWNKRPTPPPVLTLQEAKDRAANDWGYSDWDAATDLIGTTCDDIINRALEYASRSQGEIPETYWYESAFDKWLKEQGLQYRKGIGYSYYYKGNRPANGSHPKETFGEGAIKSQFEDFIKNNPNRSQGEWVNARNDNPIIPSDFESIDVLADTGDYDNMVVVNYDGVDYLDLHRNNEAGNPLEITDKVLRWKYIEPQPQKGE